MGCCNSSTAAVVAMHIPAPPLPPPPSPPPEPNRRWDIDVRDIYTEVLLEVCESAPALQLPPELAVLCAEYVRDAASACRFDHVGDGNLALSLVRCVCSTARCRGCELWLACSDPPEVASVGRQRASVGWRRFDDYWHCIICYAQRVRQNARDEENQNEWQRYRDEREAEQRRINQAHWERSQARKAADDERAAKKATEDADAERRRPTRHRSYGHRRHHRHKIDDDPAVDRGDASDDAFDALPIAVFGTVATVLAHGNHDYDRRGRL
jgi:hypothetical protein